MFIDVLIALFMAWFIFDRERAHRHRLDTQIVRVLPLQIRISEVSCSVLERELERLKTADYLTTEKKTAQEVTYSTESSPVKKKYQGNRDIERP